MSAFTEAFRGVRRMAGAAVVFASVSAAVVFAVKSAAFFASAGPLPRSAAEIAAVALSGSAPAMLASLAAGWACVVAAGGFASLAACGLRQAADVIKVRS